MIWLINIPLYNIGEAEICPITINIYTYMYGILYYLRTYGLQIVYSIFCCLQSTDGTVLETWEGVRVQAVAAHPKTNEAIAVDTHHRVRSYNFSEPKFTPL